MCRRLVLALIGGFVLTAPVTGAEPTAAPLEVRQFPERVEAGGPLRLTVLVLNRSNEPTEQVQLRLECTPRCPVVSSSPMVDASGDPPTWTLGRLAAGEQRAVTVQLTPPSDAMVTAVTSRAVVSFAGQVAATATLPVARPLVELEITGPDLSPIGQPAGIVLTLRNRGSAPVQQATLHLQLPDGLTHPGGHDLENVIGTLPPGEVRQVRLDVTPTRTGTFSGRVRLVGQGVESVERRLDVHAHDLRLRLDLRGPASIRPDWPAVYEIGLVNEGGEDITDARLAVTLPRGLAFVRASETGLYDPTAHVVAWPIGSLAPGARQTVFLQGTAGPGGDFVIQAATLLLGQTVATARITTAVSAGR